MNEGGKEWFVGGCLERQKGGEWWQPDVDVRSTGEGQGPGGQRLPQEGEEARVRGQVGVDGEGQEGGAHQVHRPLGGEVQLHGVLSLRGARPGARGEGTERPQQQQQRRRQRQPPRPAQQHLELTWLPHRRAAAQQPRALPPASPQRPFLLSSTLSLLLTPPTAPGILPLLTCIPPTAPSLPAPPPPLTPASLHAFPSVAVAVTKSPTPIARARTWPGSNRPGSLGRERPGRSAGHLGLGFPKHNVLCALVGTPPFPSSRSHLGGAGSSDPQLKLLVAHSSLPYAPRSSPIWFINTCLSLARGKI